MFDEAINSIFVFLGEYRGKNLTSDSHNFFEKIHVIAVASSKISSLNLNLHHGH